MANLINLSSIPKIDEGIIDKQHKALIDSLNKLYLATSKNKGEKEVHKTIEFCEDYTKKHFSTEEKLMKKIKFSGLDLQLKQHAWFKGEIEKLKTLAKKRELTNEQAVEIAIMLNKWFFNHIKVEDSKYSPLLDGEGLRGDLK